VQPLAEAFNSLNFKVQYFEEGDISRVTWFKEMMAQVYKS